MIQLNGAQSDALKRHWTTCKSRLDKGLSIPLPPSRPRGRKKRACERCTRLKRGCNSFQPCSTCLQKNLECSYKGVQNDTTYDDPPIREPSEQSPSKEGEAHSHELNGQSLFPEFAPPSPGIGSIVSPDTAPSLQFPDYFGAMWWPLHFSKPSLDTPWSQTCPENAGSLTKFDFLDRLTSVDGFANSFRCGTIFQRQQIASNQVIDWNMPPEEHPNPFDATDSLDATIAPIEPKFAQNVDQLLPSTQRQSQASAIDGPDLQFGPELSNIHSWAHHPLALKTQEIIERLKNTIRNKPRKSSIMFEWSSLVENMGLLFFSPPNICKFLRLFWSSWYPNCPIVHRPTFDPLNAPPSLLSSMIMIGGCLSPEKRDNQFARSWFNAVEEMVFDDEWLEEDFKMSSEWIRNPQTDFKRLQSLQAAFMVCVFQNWEGSDTSKRRIRRHRYNMLIAIARDLHPASEPHFNTSLYSSDQSFQWKSFVEREQKIRTLSYIFLLDGAFVIFNNMPPRIVVAEMRMNITCPEECFQALTAPECFTALAEWTNNVPEYHQYSIASLLETMLQPNLSLKKKELYAHFGILNLFMLITALHTFMFQLQNALAPPEAFQRIENALQNWKDIWIHRNIVLGYSDDTMEAESLPQMWKRVGFMKNAGEYWLLCRAILERIRPVEGDGSVNTVPGRVLEKFDETSMKQVNDLIKQFENVFI